MDALTDARHAAAVAGVIIPVSSLPPGTDPDRFDGYGADSGSVDQHPGVQDLATRNRALVARVRELEDECMRLAEDNHRMRDATVGQCFAIAPSSVGARGTLPRCMLPSGHRGAHTDGTGHWTNRSDKDATAALEERLLTVQGALRRACRNLTDIGYQKTAAGLLEEAGLDEETDRG